MKACENGYTMMLELAEDYAADAERTEQLATDLVAYAEHLRVDWGKEGDARRAIDAAREDRRKANLFRRVARMCLEDAADTILAS